MVTEFKTAQDVVAEAARLVGGDRAAQHGDKLENFTKIARLWSAYLRNAGFLGDLDAGQAADMMELLKVARRQSGGFNPDDYIDGAGYAGVAFETRLRQEAIDQERNERADKLDALKRHVDRNDWRSLPGGGPPKQEGW